jgi:3-phenylpropionate/trans-cinnamate dioxygenase ferredoxin reductase component
MSPPSAISIVGASLAGMHAAHTLRKEGYAGSLTVVDADPNPPYDKPPLSKQVLAGEWDADRIGLAAAKEDLGIDWKLGHRATALDLAAGAVDIEGGDGPARVGFDRLIIATGAAARRLPDTPDLGGIHVLRTLDDCLSLRADLDRGPARVVVIGAGFIGAEVAATCRGRGLEVTMIEALDVPLERALGARMGMLMADIHREHGVDLRLGVGLAGFDGDGNGRVSGVRLADGSTVAAEVVVVGVGVAPNTAWLDGSGLTIDNGIVVDATLEAAPGVVAAGDIARWPSARFGESLRIEHWENAIQMGEAAARRVLVDNGAPAAVYDPVPWFWSDQYDRKIQLAGRSGADADLEVVHGSLEERRFVALYGRAGRVIGVLGMNRPRHVMQLRGLVVDAVGWDEGLARARELT